MLRNLIRLSDGREISSGSGESMNIRSCTITQCVNSGDELTIGSVCAACVEMVVEAPDGTFKPEDTFTLFKIDDAGNRTQVGIFNVFKPEKKGDRLCKVTAYDNVIKLDKDLTQWLNEKIGEISGAPDDFVRAVCEQCGVRLADTFPGFSQWHYVDKFSPKGTVTGRKLVQWVAEMMCCFCIAGFDGNIRFGWYRDNTNVELSAQGGRYRLYGSYKFKGHILPVDCVVVFYDTAPNGEMGSIYHTCNGQSSNPYIIKDNPILEAKEREEDVGRIGDEIMIRLDHDRIICSHGYMSACEVVIPASMDINVGDIIVVDKQNPEQDEIPLRLYMRVMTKIQKGPKDTLQCVGSYRRRN